MIKLLLFIIVYPSLLAIGLVAIIGLFHFIVDRFSSSPSVSPAPARKPQVDSSNSELLARMMSNVMPDTPSGSSSYAAPEPEEPEEKEYFDQDEAYGRVPLENLPDSFTFLDDPYTVYHHYAYLTGGLGQKVRVYREGGSGRQVQISWAHNGMLVGRDFTTDIGKIEKYGF